MHTHTHTHTYPEPWRVRLGTPLAWGGALSKNTPPPSSPLLPPALKLPSPTPADGSGTDVAQIRHGSVGPGLVLGPTCSIIYYHLGPSDSMGQAVERRHLKALLFGGGGGGGCGGNSRPQ